MFGVSSMRERRYTWESWGKAWIVLSLFLSMTTSAAADDGQRSKESLLQQSEIAAEPGRKLVLISVPALSFLEIGEADSEAWPHLSALLRSSAVGAMNIRTPERGLKDSYLTFGAGAMAIARKPLPPLSRHETWMGEKATDLYSRYNSPVTDHAKQADVVVAAAEALDSQNRKYLYGAKIGSLGQALDQGGVSRYVFGNSDLGRVNDASSAEAWNRFAPLMLMDEAGIVPFGEIGSELLLSEARRPFGVKTDYDRLLQRMRETPAPAVILVELGDLERLYAERTYYAEQKFQEMKLQVLSEIDQFIGHWAASVKNGEGAVWIFSPKTNPDANSKRLLLAPWIQYDPAESREAMLTSRTTRQPGIVSNLDLAASVLNYFDIPAPPTMVGFAVERSAQPDALQQLQAEVEHIRKVYAVRPQILYSFVSYEIGVLLASLLFTLLAWKSPARLLRLPLLSLLIAPAVMLLMGYVSQASTTGLIFLFLLGLGSFMYIAGKLPLLHALGLAGLLNLIVILFDGILFNALAMKRSILGYDVMYGARYYGIGNEFMGVLIGAVVLFISIVLHAYGHHRLQKHNSAVALVVGLVFLAIIFYIGAPSLGTNAGGAIAATVTFGIAWTRWFTSWWMRSISWPKLLAIIAGLGAFAFLVLWLVHAVLPWGQEQQSHIGRAMGLLIAGRFDSIGEIMLRKITMNWHLLGVSSWSKVLITSLFVMAVLIIRPQGVFKRWQERHPLLMYGYSANAIGAIAALAVNDSGIVAAATMIVFVAVPMLLFKLRDIQSSIKTSHSS